MSEYVAIYKCRVCGETIEGCHTGKGVAMKSMIDIMNTGKGELTQSPWLIESHSCEGGSIEITDFQGFKKVGE